MVQQDSHENLTTKDEVKSGSDKSFGLVFGVVFAVIGLRPLLNVQPIRFWALVVSVLLVLLSYALPQILAPFNRLWFLFGRLLHKIVNPIVMGLIFYTTVTPIGLILRLLGKRPIPVKFDPDIESYWIKREPPGPTPESMSQQF